MKKIFFYFLRGLLFIFPIAATAILLIAGARWLDGLLAEKIEKVFGFNFFGLGIITIFFAIVAVGFAVSHFFGKRLIPLLEQLINKIPLIKIIYSGLKDFSQAFIGDKKKFNKPVMVKMSQTGILKLGFVTEEDVKEQLGIEDYMAVYFPHSYNFSGNLFLVPKENITPIKGNTTEIMKFIVSAGVMTVEEQKKMKKEIEKLAAD
jgi:uncharacterized membrane protein